MNEIKRTERGWGGHFICADRCLFRRNTLLEYGKVKVVVSTVGAMKDHYRGTDISPIGLNRYFETMAFHSDPKDTRYHDADVTRALSFKSPWSIDNPDADDTANDMHESAVAEITELIIRGDIK